MGNVGSLSHRIHLTNPRLLEEPAFRPPVFHTQQLSKPFISHAQRIFNINTTFRLSKIAPINYSQTK